MSGWPGVRSVSGLIWVSRESALDPFWPQSRDFFLIRLERKKSRRPTWRTPTAFIAINTRKREFGLLRHSSVLPCMAFIDALSRDSLYHSSKTGAI